MPTPHSLTPGVTSASVRARRTCNAPKASKAQLPDNSCLNSAGILTLVQSTYSLIECVLEALNTRLLFKKAPFTNSSLLYSCLGTKAKQALMGSGTGL